MRNCRVECCICHGVGSYSPPHAIITLDERSSHGPEESSRWIQLLSWVQYGQYNTGAWIWWDWMGTSPASLMAGCPTFWQRQYLSCTTCTRAGKFCSNSLWLRICVSRMLDNVEVSWTVISVAGCVGHNQRGGYGCQLWSFPSAVPHERVSGRRLTWHSIKVSNPITLRWDAVSVSNTSAL